MARKGTAHRTVLALLAIFSPVLSFGAGALTVTGKVDRAASLAGATVSLLPLTGSPAPVITSTAIQADGNFRLSIDQPGFYVVRVQAPGFVPMEHGLEPVLEDLRLPEVQLAQDLGLPVQVKDPTGQPLADALVRGASLPHLGPDATPWRRSTQTATTGKDGLARLAWSRGERLAVQAFRADLGESVQQVSPPAPQRAQGLTLTLVSPRRQRVRVLDPEGKPQTGVVADGGEGHWRLGQTGDDGSLTIAAAPGRGIDVELHAADGRQGTLRLAGDEPDPISIVLAPLPHLTGRLVSASDGAPVRQGFVWPTDHSDLFTRSDNHGKLTIALPGNGSRTLEAAAAGFAPKQLAIASTHGASLEIALDPVLSLTGKVVEPSGRPVAGAEIQAFPSTAPLHAAARCISNNDGAFRLSLLETDRNYRVEVRREGYGTSHRDVPAAPRPRGPENLIVVLRPGRAAFGTIRDQEGKPVPSARVVLAPGGAKEEPLPAVVSDPKGVFHLEAIAPGSFTLSVKASGFAPLTLPNLVVPAGQEPWDLGTAFLKSGVAIEGRVIQKDGSPVSGAHVRVLSHDTEQGRPPAGEDAQVDTDEDGRFTLADQAAGLPRRLEVSAAGFLPVLSPEVAPPTAEPVTVVLTSSGQIAGRVLAGGAPVAGAVVVAEVDAGSPPGRRFHTASEADGSFLFRDVEPGNLILSASAEGYAESPRIPLALPPGERRDEVEIHLETGGTVTGTVSTREGAALAEAVIEAFAETGGTDGPPPAPRTATSDPAGHFRVGGLRPGSWLFVASHAGFARKSVRQRIGGGEQPPLDFALDPGTEIAGMVTDAGAAPLSGVRVLLRQDGRGTSGLALVSPVQEREVVSQADGSFRFSGVEDGSYRLRAAKAGFAPAEPAEPIAVANAPINGIVLRLTRGSSVSGHLLGLTPEDLAGIEVLASQPAGKLARGEVGPDGGYRLTDLEPGAWWLIAQVKGTGKRATGQVTLAEQPASLDLDFTRGAVLSGAVTVDGRPFAGAIVQLSSPSLGGAAVATQSGGSFRISGLVEGLYSLQVEVPASRLRHVEEIDLSSDREVRIDLLTSTTTHRQPPRDP